jgi:flagellar motor switch protein FliN/FliY
MVVEAPSPSRVEGTAHHLRDLPLPVEVLLAQTTGRLGEITSMRVGSVILSNRLIGEPLDLLVNGVRLATGEIINAGGNRGLRIRKMTVEG